MLKLSKEQKDLEETYIKYKEYQKVINNIEEAKMLIDDPEMGEMAKLELDEASARKDTLISELEILLIPKDENDDKDIISHTIKKNKPFCTATTLNIEANKSIKKKQCEEIFISLCR